MIVVAPATFTREGKAPTLPWIIASISIKCRIYIVLRMLIRGRPHVFIATGVRKLNGIAGFYCDIGRAKVAAVKTNGICFG